MDLRNNGIRDIELGFFAAFPKVQTLLLGQNQLTAVALGPPLAMPDTIYLSLKENMLTELGAHSLAAFSGVLTFEADKNAISRMHPAVFLPAAAPAFATHPLVTLGMFRNEFADLASPANPTQPSKHT